MTTVLFFVIKIVFVTHMFFFLCMDFCFTTVALIPFPCLVFYFHLLPTVLTTRVFLHRKSSLRSAHNFVCPDTFVTPPPAPWWFLNGKGIQVQNASTSNAVSARHTQKQCAPLHHLNSTGACVVISSPVCFWGFLCPGCLRPQSTSRSKESTKRARCQLHTGSRRLFGQNRPNG